MYNQVKWESEWILSHLEEYDGPMHQKAVIGNIEKRARIAELEGELDRSAVKILSKAMCDEMNHSMLVIGAEVINRANND